MDPAVVAHQLHFGTTVLIDLAALVDQRAVDGGRVVAIGSSAGTRQPALPLASYSLGKAAMEHTVRLLAPELARKRVTVNAVCPTFLPVGMHESVTDQRRIRMEEARIPLGRLCAPDDVISTVEYLLSPEASFVSGECIQLSGGQL